MDAFPLELLGLIRSLWHDIQYNAKTTLSTRRNSVLQLGDAKKGLPTARTPNENMMGIERLQKEGVRSENFLRQIPLIR